MKSLHGRCIQRWKQRFKSVCDSKVSPYYRKRDLKGFCRESGVITADMMIQNMAENNAIVDFNGGWQGWSPEFSEFFDKNREKYITEARLFLNEEATNDEIDDLIEEEISNWN
ncbi:MULTISPECIES: hypothetical protein [Proteus]|uniref:Uncharacterized protein n=1 Tax=Proteus penneri TaxID=102862 RepID=A0A0G4QC13_9GAMM|nr:MULTISPECIES: hypothetical protein [Proteus]QAV24996.1 hypothetical protein PH4a_17300 [Proteus hauseri]CRL63099.1 hypothetical protein BN1804_02333 [Proteus penneri]